MILSEPGEFCPASKSKLLITDAATLHNGNNNTEPNDTCSITDDDYDDDEDYIEQEDATKQVLSSFQNVTTTPPRTPPRTLPSNNYTLTTNLDSIDVDYSYAWGKTKIVTNNTNNTSSTKKRELCDSHTSYRRVLEQSAVTLKLQLAEAQERADTLQNDLNISTKQCITDYQTLQDLENRYSQSQRLAEGLATVVTHLQSNAQDCAAERSALYTKIDEYEKEKEIARERSKIFRFENRRLKKEVQEGRRELAGQKMEIQGLKSENDMFRKEKLRNKSRNNTDGGKDDEIGGEGEGGSGASRILEGLPVIAEFREFLSPSPKSGRSLDYAPETPTTQTNNLEHLCTSNTNDVDNTSQATNIRLSPSYKSNYTSFADITLAPSSGDDCVISNDEKTKDVLTIPALPITTSTINNSGKKRMVYRRIRRKTSIGARNFFNTLAQRHIQGNMEASEDDASDNNSIPQAGRRRRWSGYSPRGGVGVEVDKINPVRDLPERWQDVAVTTPSRNNKNVNDDVDRSSLAERLMVTPSRWSWFWKNENNPENANTASSPALQQRNFTPWFLNSSPNEEDLPRNEHKACDTEGVDQSLEGSVASSEGFRNTLVPRRLENPVFY